MTGEKKAPIIKKVIKKKGAAGGGGSWKVAYADFVTALMAFFLVMWLLAISSESGREALADYYKELTFSDAVFNGGIPSAFNDKARPKSILEGGCFAPKDTGDAIDNKEDNEEMSSEQVAALLKTTVEFLENLESLPEGVDGGEGSGEIGRSDAQPQLPMNEEEREFTSDLMNEIEENLGSGAAEQVMMEKVKGGLRIQIIDESGRPTFRSGGALLTQEGRSLIDLVGNRLSALPNQISIEGHTDAKPFIGQKSSNWELSTARASATRVALVGAGINESRLLAVTGYASTRPLADTNPNDAVNRRVSIMVWDNEDPSGKPLIKRTPKLSLPFDRSNTRLSERPSSKRPPRPLSREELEQHLIDSVMEESATPDLSSVGPSISDTDQ